MRCLSLGLLGLTLVSPSVVSAAPRAKTRPPNIVFILADDLGWGDIGPFGQKGIKTPYLDRMAAEGTRFTQVYSGSTVCAPSRSVLMTGQHVGHTRVRGNRAGIGLGKDDVTVAEVLKSRGYRTAAIGKWGLGNEGSEGAPTRQGFDEFFGYLDHKHAHNYWPTHLWRNEEKVPLRNKVPNETARGAGVATERAEYAADRITEEALAFLRRQSAGEQPFFLYFTPTLPHANNEAKDRGLEVPDLGEYKDRDWPAPRKAHAAMVSRLDRDVGRVLALLKELALDERTLVIFSSDNGPHKEGGYDPALNDSNGPWRGIKRDLYEGGIRVPTIARWPGKVPAGKTSDATWHFADVLPTVAKLAGVRRPATAVDGIDVSSVLTGRTSRLRERFLYWEFHEGGFSQAARWKQWKAVIPPRGKLELYDLVRDPGETNDVAAAQPAIAARLKAYLAGARSESPEWPIQTTAMK